jgi:hypothetical protein
LYRYIFLILAILTYLLNAKGVRSGTNIENFAKIETKINGIKYTKESNIDIFVVDKVVDINLKWQDSKAVDIAALEKKRVLTFALKNEGNSEDNIYLSYEHNSSSAFKPLNVKIYIDSDGDGVYSSGDKEVNELSLKPDSMAMLYIVANMPDSNLSANDKSYDGILAKSMAKESKGADNKEKVDVVYRTNKSQDEGIYIVRDYFLVSKKSQEILSTDKKAHTGSKIRYKITLSIGGNSKNKSIKNIKVADKIDSKVKYLANTIKLNGNSLTDTTDSDSGEFKDNTIFVNIDSLNGDANQTITFDTQTK